MVPSFNASHNLSLFSFSRIGGAHLNKVFPNATCFQYDYLNDDIEWVFLKDKLSFTPNWKLPKKLREELADPTITWIVE